MSEEVTYDSMGNILKMTRNGTIGQYLYSGNRLTTITGMGPLPYTYYYDANGNMTKNGRNLDSLTYNALNLPKSVTRAGQSVSYLYAMDGTKLRKISTVNGATITTHYVDGIQYNGNNIEFIQTEEGIARRSGANYSYEFHLTDHLGNVRTSFHKNPVTNALEILQKDNYLPFGKRVVVTAGTNKYLYNGKELQEESETYDYGARFYDPVIARWNVIDAKAEKFYSFSPYNYVVNNPLKYIDPDGNDIILVVRGHENQKERTLTYRNGNAYWNDTGKKYEWKGANNTVARVLKAYQKIEKSDDAVLKNQLHTLEKSERQHFVEASPNGENAVQAFGIPDEKGRIGTQTEFDFSKNGKNDSDLSTVAHEMRHQYDHEIGNMKDNQKDNTARDPAEIRATNNENRAKKIEGLPPTTTYGGEKIDPEKLKNPPNNY